MAEQHVCQLAQSDMSGVEGGGSRLVIDVVGIGSANPQTARTPWPEAERAQPDRAVSPTLQLGHESAQVERDRSSSPRRMAACCPFAPTRNITYLGKPPVRAERHAQDRACVAGEGAQAVAGGRVPESGTSGGGYPASGMGSGVRRRRRPPPDPGGAEQPRRRV